MARTKVTPHVSRRVSQDVQKPLPNRARMTAAGHIRRLPSPDSHLPQWRYDNELKAIAHIDGCRECSAWMRHYIHAMTSGDPSLDTARQARDRELCALRSNLNKVKQQRNDVVTKLAAVSHELDVARELVKKLDEELDEARAMIEAEDRIAETLTPQSRKRPRHASTPPSCHESEVIYLDDDSSP
jgi:hypothetical protein